MNLLSKNIETFLDQVYKLPYLSTDEETSLFLNYSERNDIKSLEKLILHNVKYVANLANKLRNYGLNRYDLIQEGTIGLMESVNGFDLSKGVRFFTYASFHVKNKMFAYIRKNWKIISLPDTRTITKMFFNIRSKKSKHAWFTAEEVQALSDEFGTPKEDITKMEYFLYTGDVHFDQASLDEQSDGNTMITRENLFDENSDLQENYIQDNTKKRMLMELHTAKRSLTERELFVIDNRFSEHPKTLQELSLELGVSLERVRQIEKAAIGKLSNQMKKFEL